MLTADRPAVHPIPGLPEGVEYDPTNLQHREVALASVTFLVRKLARQIAARASGDVRAIGGLEDLVQVGLQGAWEATEVLRPELGKVSTFLGTRADWKMRQALQRPRYRREHCGWKLFPLEVVSEASGWEPLAREGEPTVEDEDEVTFGLVRPLVDQLPERCRAVVLLALEGHERAEIAQRLGITRERVRQLWNKASKLLRDLLPQGHERTHTLPGQG